jgi:hypothetical protein
VCCENQCQNKCHLKPAQQITDINQRRNGNAQTDCPADDRPFGIAVGQKSGGGKKQNEWQQDTGVDQGRERYLGGSIVTFENGILDNDLMAKIDDGIGQNNQNIGNESPPVVSDSVCVGAAKEPDY